MKLNTKVYKYLADKEPFETQEIDGKKVDFHYMNDTPFLFQYGSKGRFAIWASNGQDYKVLVEKSYYDVMKDFYQRDVNAIWLNFLERISVINRRINLMFIIPTLLIYLVIAFVASLYFQDNLFVVLLILLGTLIVTNVIQNRIIGRRVREQNREAQDAIRKHIGQESFEKLISAQEEHYRTYFNFDEEDRVIDDAQDMDKPENKEQEEDEDGPQSD
ncbi:MAG: hypothetical protein ACLFTZ_02445 [Acholeplasmataceae bacterium]